MWYTFKKWLLLLFSSANRRPKQWFSWLKFYYSFNNKCTTALICLKNWNLRWNVSLAAIIHSLHKTETKLSKQTNQNKTTTATKQKRMAYSFAWEGFSPVTIISCSEWLRSIRMKNNVTVLSVQLLFCYFHLHNC